MTTLTVAATHNYSPDSLSGIDVIAFTNAIHTAATATFANTQFGTQILNNVQFNGSAGANNVIVNGGSVNAFLWTFNSWSVVDSIRLNGSTGDNTIIGSSQDDVITGGGGVDSLTGGDGEDTFSFIEQSSGDTVKGGAGTDTLRFDGANSFQLSSTIGIEKIVFSVGTDVTLDDPHFGTIATFINEVTGSAGVDSIIARGSDLDLSAVAFTSWNAVDHVSLLGTDGDDTLVGTAFGDLLSAGVGTDRLIGGEGDDVFSLADHVSAGDFVDGGSGSGDELVIALSADLRHFTQLTNIEKLHYSNASDTSVFATGQQVRAGTIATVTGSSKADVLVVLGISVDLSGVAFVNWTSADHINVTGSNAAASILIGSNEIDNIHGGTFNDTMSGGAGDDFINGEDGLGDTAEFSGAWIEYVVSTGGGNRTVSDSIANRDGTDTFANTEIFAFSNGSFTAPAIANDAPIGVDDTNSGDPIAAGTDSTASGNVLGNDTDLDSALGDTRTVTGLRTGAESGGGPLGAVGTIAGAHGVLALNADGTYIYTLGGNDPAVQALAAGQVATDVFTYRVQDAKGLIDQAQLTISIAATNDAPIITSNDGGATTAISIAENTSTVTTVTSSDVDTGSVRTYSLVGGVDQGKFQIGSSTGALTFIAAPDFETPTDIGGDNTYDVIVRASDGGLGDNQAIAVTVSNIAGHAIKGHKTKADTIYAANPTGNAATGEEDTINGRGGNDTIKAQGGNDTVKGGVGKDVLDGGAGIDTADYSDKSVGVVLKLNGSKQAVATVGGVSEDKVKNLENINGGKAGDTLTGDTKANVLKGNSGRDRLDGGKQNDAIDGGKGNDTLIGGLGSDTLTGGANHNSFVFNTRLGPNNIDLVTDFVHNADLIQLDDGIFKAIGPTLVAGEFFASAGAVAGHDKNDRIVYDTATGNLYYDADGSRTGASSILFATLTTKPLLDVGDVDIV